MPEIKIENNIKIPSINIGMKRCCTCKIEKLLLNFSFEKSNKDGYSRRCKECKRNESKRYYKNNKEKVLLRIKKYHRTEKGKKITRDAIDRYYKTERGKESLRISSRKKYSTSNGKISSNISARIYYSLKGNKHGKHWEDLVGYTLKQLMDYLENQFENWMNWSNYGRSKNGERTWSIDHIIPISNFNFNFNFDSYEDEEFKKCWSLENLRPLDHIENIKKSNNILE